MGEHESFKNPTYDELGNERHKAVCELRKMPDGYPKYSAFPFARWYKDLSAAIGLSSDEISCANIRDRLIHLLGGDQSQVPVSMGPENETNRTDNGTCPNDVPTASITEELRECVETACKTYDNTVWYEMDGDTEDEHTWCSITVAKLLAIADRIDEQFDRCCEMWERTTIDTAQDVHDDMEEECNRLVAECDELREHCENQRKRLGELERACNFWHFDSGHQLSPMEAYKKMRRVQERADKLERRANRLQVECGRLTKALDEIQAEPVNDVICRIERERDELLVKLEGYEQTHMKLPLDRKGVSVHPGDAVRLGEGTLTEVIAVSEKNIVWQDGDYPDHPHLKQRGAHNVEVPRPEPDTVDRIAEDLRAGKISVQEAITRLQDMARFEAARVDG